MIKLQFENTSIIIPEGWHDIKLSDYERWNVQKPENKQEYVRFVADVCNVEADVLLEAPAQVFEIITDAIRFVFDSEPEPSNKVNIGGKNYFVSFSDKLTLGEWVDIEGIIGSEGTGKLSEMLAVLCRPAGEKYNPDVAQERQAMFADLTCDKVLPLIGFFLFKKRRSDEILSHYSTVVDQANRFLKDTETFAINGGGIKLLPIWQRIRYIYLVRSLRKQLLKFSDSSSIA